MGLDDLIWWAAATSAAAGTALALFWTLRSKCFVSVPSNRALVIPGRGPAPTGPGIAASNVTIHRPRIIVGGGTYVAPWNRAVNEISLEPVSVEVTVRSVQALEKSHASGWEVRLHVQAKVPADPGFLTAAAENLPGKTDEELRAIVRRAVESAVPAVLARLTPEQGEPDWDRLAAELQASVAPDLVPWGLAVRALSVVELRRLRPPEPPTALSTTRSVPSLEPSGGRASLGLLLAEIEVRLSKTERSLGILGAELLRQGEGRLPSRGEVRDVPVLDLPLGWEDRPSDEGGEGTLASLHDSMGGARSPRFRPSPHGVEREVEGSELRPPMD